MNRLFVALSALLLASPSFAQLSGSYVINSSNSALVTINPSTLGYTIPCDFVGFSFEESSIVQSPSLNNNTALKTSMSNIMGACSHVRFGGNTADTNTPLLSRVTDAANFVKGFNGGAGWNSIYSVGCPLNYPSATNGIAQASAFKAVGGSQATIAIGNEPNFYNSTITPTSPLNSTIVSFSAGAGGSGSISVAGNYSTWFYVGETIVISGSTSNNGTFTIATVTYSSPNTILVLNQAVAADSSTTAIATYATIANGCYSFPSYQTAWQSINNAIAASPLSTVYEAGDPGVTTNSPNDNYTPMIAAALGSQLGYLSVHTYCTTPGTSVLNDVLSAWVSTAAVNEITTIKSNSSVAASGLNLRLTETGCSTVGGNVLGNSIFTLWELQLLAQNSWLGADFHMGDATLSAPGYSPLLLQSNGSYLAQPTMYAMRMFANLVGCQLEALTTTLPSNVTPLAAKCPNNKSYVLIVNRSVTNFQAVVIASTASFSSIDSEMYTATSYAASTVYLGYSTISNTGTYSPQTYNVPNTVNIPPSSAVLLTVNP